MIQYLHTKERRPIIGVDFDDTLFRNSYPCNDADPNWPVIRYLQKRKWEDNAYLILITCRFRPWEIEFAAEAARRVGLEFDAINENLPFMIEKVGDPRKIYCNEYIDDKNLSIRKIEKIMAQ